MTASERDRIADAAAKLDTPISAHQIDQLVHYLDLLERWNRTYNLTSIRQRDDMLVQHVFDCLSVVRPLERAGFATSDAVESRCLDVGSGGGLPAVVLAIMCPSANVVSVDPVGKKASFVRQVALEIGLGNLSAEHARVENLSLPRFDWITSRAFASLVDFVRLTEPQLSEVGVWVAMKARRPDDEIAALPSEIEVFHVEQLVVPELDAARCLVWMRRKAANESARRVVARHRDPASKTMQ